MSQWYETWFNHLYADLYAYRDTKQAEGQVQIILDVLSLSLQDYILDIGCGVGRHLEVFLKQGFLNSWGMDLSADLLNLVKNTSQVVRGNMTQIPFRVSSFCLITSFFSSFGYFKTREEDIYLLKKMKNLLKPQGHLFLDLANKNWVTSNLVDEDQRENKGYHIIQKRSIFNNVVTKDIIITNKQGESKVYQENLRLYTLPEMEEILSQENLQVKKIYGTELGGFFESNSPRMSLLIYKP